MWIFQADKPLIPESHLVEVKYEDLTENPGSLLKKLQNDLLSDLNPNDSKLGSILETHQKHAPNRYDFEKGYVERVNTELGTVIEKQGYKLL